MAAPQLQAGGAMTFMVLVGAAVHIRVDVARVATPHVETRCPQARNCGQAEGNYQREHDRILDSSWAALVCEKIREFLFY